MLRSLLIPLLALAITFAAHPGKAGNRPFLELFGEAAQAARELQRDRLRRRSYLKNYDEGLLSPYIRFVQNMDVKPTDADLLALEELIAEKHGVASCIAWLVIARAGDSAVAQEIITKHAANGDVIAILAVSFMPSPLCKKTSERLVAAERVFVPGKVEALRLLSHVGDASTLAMLKELRPAMENKERLSALDCCLQCLETKLSHTPEEQQLWTDMGVAYWRAALEAPRFVKIGSRYTKAAARLAESGRRFPTDFLKCRVEACDPLAIVIAGEQREKSLVEPIAKVARRGGWMSDLALTSLAKIGNNKALQALRSCMTPGPSYTNRRIADALWSYGGPEAGELLEALLQDEEYKESWPYLKSALEMLQQRMEQERHKKGE